MAAAAATFSEPSRPRSGIDATTSQRWRTRRDRPGALGAEHEDDRIGGERQVVQRRVAAGVEPDHPQPGRLQPLEGRREPADEGDRQVLDGPGRGLGDRRGDVDRPVAGQHDAR